MATNTSAVTTETKQTGSQSRPWENNWGPEDSHADLLNARQGAPKEVQDKLAPWEHRAFAREAVAENPAMAVPLAVAIPAYQVSKVMGLEKSRSDPSMAQVTEAYKGIGEGLAKPWEKAWGAVEQTVNKAVETVKEAVGEPWTKMWGDAPVVPQKPPVAPVRKSNDDRFESIFARLIHQESRGKHTDASGNLTTSPVGAQGLTQVMPKTGVKPGYGVTPLRDNSAAEYERFGRDYLKAMLNEFDGDYEKALAAYNAGAGNVKRAITKGGENWKQFLPKKKETLPYIEKILRGNNGKEGPV